MTRTLPGVMQFKEGIVTHRRPDAPEATAHEPQELDLGDALRTAASSRASGWLQDKSRFRMKELTRLQLVRHPDLTNVPNLHLEEGAILYSSGLRGPKATTVLTPFITLTNKGTEYVIAVDRLGQRTEVTMFDGEAELSDGTTNVIVHTGEHGVAIVGQGIEVRPILEVTNLVQWWLYYPGVLDPEELDFTPAEMEPLRASLDAYRAGDLPQALQQFPGYPTPAEPVTSAQSLYLAGLFLSVGAVNRAEPLLQTVPTNAPLALALRTMINAVQSPATADEMNPVATVPLSPATHQSPSLLLALSYLHQSRHHLKDALAAARAAADHSPQFGFAWARVADLEFGFGRTRLARRALERALKLAPRNAQAHALRGFLLAADNRTSEALVGFDDAIRLDPALANAWLGRGLCKIRRTWNVFGFPISSDKYTSGLDDLTMAALLEPNRALLHGYVGKAFADLGDRFHARKELDYSQRLDPNDPTAWLYSALLRREHNEVNDAVRDLERSIELNDNRAVYRSQLLLDQDRAVRGGNLARLSEDAGMTDVAVREAVRAVNADYANYSGHLFLANSYDRLRDPRQINLRYETPWLTEYLLANLLAPVGAGTLSQAVSQQEYSRLFERNRVGVVSSTEYLSRGDWVQTGSLFGHSDHVGYALDTTYASEQGHRPNNDLEQLTASLQLKLQLSPRDGIFFQSLYYDAEAGDVRPYYDDRQAHAGLRVKESQEPLLLTGFHHEWSPASHTLLLAGRLQDTLRLRDPEQGVLLLGLENGEVIGLPYPGLPAAPLDYRSEFEAYTAEAQHLLRVDPHTLIGGARIQAGTFHTRDELGPTIASGLAGEDFTNVQPFAVAGVGPQKIQTDLQRLTFYAYDQWQLIDPLLLSLGVSYDHLTSPHNFRAPPISAGEQTQDLVSPKAGLTWTPWRGGTLRAAYARALGGVSFDQSFRLEPSQVAGFNQAYRSVVPEAVAGSIAAEKIDLGGVSLEQKFGAGTYLGAEAELLESEYNRQIGAVDNPQVPLLFDHPTTTTERGHYRERTLTLTANQLLRRDWSVGASYRISDADLDRRLSDILATVGPLAQRNESAVLQQLRLFALFNHRSGFFAQLDALWSHQSNRGAASDLAGDDFWQFNVFGGFRFARRRAEVRVGVLNLMNQDYHLNPLNLTAELPHERTFYSSLRFSF